MTGTTRTELPRPDDLMPKLDLVGLQTEVETAPQTKLGYPADAPGRLRYRQRLRNLGAPAVEDEEVDP